MQPMSFWADVTTSAIGSAVGAIAGGLLAYVGGLKVAQRTIEASRADEAARRERERADERDRRAQDAARELLGPLAEVRPALPAMSAMNNVPEPRLVTQGEIQVAVRVYANLGQLLNTVLPLIPSKELDFRFRTLVRLIGQLLSTQETPHWKARGLRVMLAYVQYVQLSVVAVVRGESMPDSATPPDLMIAIEGTEEQDWLPDPLPDGWL